MREASDFDFESVELLQYNLYKIKLKRGRSYIESPEWIRNKLATKNPKNEGHNNCFQYAITIALNHQNIETIQKEYQTLDPFLTNIIWGEGGINFFCTPKWSRRK